MITMRHPAPPSGVCPLQLLQLQWWSLHPMLLKCLLLVPQTPSVRPKLKPKVTLPDLVSTMDETEVFIPTSYADLHNTGIPRGVCMRQLEKTTARGSSLYICPHQDCGSTPYVGDLYGCSSHIRRVHYGTSLMCSYCPNQKYYHISG